MRKIIAVAVLAIAAVSNAATKPGRIGTPQISCAGGTQVSRSITVCAPASGLPAGFSLQWMTCDALAANGGAWFDSEDLRARWASFSGNANLSRYRLAAGECVTVDIGDVLLDAGASTNGAAELSCGTCYVFRAFGHAASTLLRSEFTSDLTCSTLACGSGEHCNYPFTGWSVLGPPCDPGADFAPVVTSEGWPLTTLTLGTTAYTDGRARCILDIAADGNGLIALAHQLIAAKLNVARNGQPPASIATCISDADALIGGLVVPPVGTGFLDPTATDALTSCLTGYNEGAVGPGACVPPDPGEDMFKKKRSEH